MSLPTERVLVVDPGDRTGWARATLHEGGAITDISQGVNSLKDFALAFGRSLTETPDRYDTVIYETWRLRPDMARKMVGNDFQPVQLIGVIRYFSWTTPNLKLVSLAPSVKRTGRKVMPPTLEERLSKSSEEHDKDALDLLSFYWFQRYA